MEYLHFNQTKDSGVKNSRKSAERLLSVVKRSLSMPSLKVTMLQYTLFSQTDHLVNHESKKEDLRPALNYVSAILQVQV